ncbi:HigA family addiction module antidote protein [Pseudomonas sp. REP124]|uniref:HigA family addiction module antitoxin n=1 Tax=Pseudomonas sp. REP124 TaxID=2875731 RepID=UPI001CC98D44|nr:HigA family addiction module antitoxin [Pseudomonas sp. REP124]MBZ9785171.1 HigA family addiction module antidote protein [Pseudomonas sp. REP124]
MSSNGMRPVHPGEILSQEFMKPLGMSILDLAVSMHEPLSEVVRLTECRIRIDADLAIKLSKVFKTTPEFWMNLQSTYDLRRAQIRSGSLPVS